MKKKNQIKLPKGTIIPNHIAIVLDGNGRWARSKGLPATKGHEEAAKNLRNIIEASRSVGVHTLTLWGFSTENWKRPPMEVKKIFSLIKRYVKEELKIAEKEKVRFYHLGRKDRLPLDLLRWIKKAEEETKDNDKFILNLALDYGGRDEILRAIKRIVKDQIKPNKIDEDLFSSYLDTAGQPYPNPDLFIRTSGEQRTSGLMPWQMVYSEFYFEEVHLPDLSAENIREAILDYSRRRRRFGAKDRVVHFKFKPEVVAGLEVNWWRLRNIPQGTRFRDFALMHVKEQFGLSRHLAKEAAKYFAQGVVDCNQKKWVKGKKALGKFYELIKGEVKLAFEPSLAASLQVKIWKDSNKDVVVTQPTELEDTVKHLYAEVYRISLFQAGKAAHLFALATIERNLAERGMGEEHWAKAEDYLQKFYSALKERVA